ncbi:MAG: TIGR00730 family Rossman fold protein [Azospira sp.]|jgi:uncharacterized protein (TIGR00730 family)|nr:TIGR00730 family Rossman fold protein [Azospira sp.]
MHDWQPKRLCVFCGSARGRRPEYAATATAMGELLAERGIGLVYGGGNIGLMGLVADACLRAGGEAIGVIPEALMQKEVGHLELTRLEVVGSMHARKARMAELSDGFVALPGGFGTFEELCEVLTWGQLGFHEKPVGLVNVAGYFAPLIALCDRAVDEGFMRPEHRGLLQDAETPEAVLTAMAGHEPVKLEKWIRELREL